MTGMIGITTIEWHACLRRMEMNGKNNFNNSEIALIFTQICAYVRQLKKFLMDTKFRDFIDQ